MKNKVNKNFKGKYTDNPVNPNNYSTIKVEGTSEPKELTLDEFRNKEQGIDCFLSRNDRFKLGIKKYGFESDFMRAYNSLCAQLRYDEIDMFFDEWLIEKENSEIYDLLKRKNKGEKLTSDDNYKLHLWLYENDEKYKRAYIDALVRFNNK